MVTSLPEWSTEIQKDISQVTNDEEIQATEPRGKQNSLQKLNALLEC